MNQTKYDVFISHSSKDSQLAFQLCEYLEKDGIKCWIAPRDVTAGIPYARAIFEGIDTSQVVLLLFSDASNQSRHVEREIDRAFNKEKIIIPFRVSDIDMSDVLSYYIGVNHHIDGIPNPVSAFENLKSHIERNLPDRHKQMDIDHILAQLAELKGVSIDALRNAILSLRTSDNDCFEDLLQNFIQRESDQPTAVDRPLSNEVGIKGGYSIHQNDKGEIMIMMDAREGKPSKPRFIYDGNDTALLYRNENSSVAFRGIGENAQDALKHVSEILIVEIVKEDVEREYMVPVRFVKSVENLLVE